MIAILTALETEYAAIRAHLISTKRHEHAKGTIFEVGVLAARPTCRVALAATGMTNLNAALLTERAIAEFNPSTTMFVGVAGGRRDWLQLGDVVVATRVYSYHGGRSEDTRFRVRPRAWEISHRAEQVARWLSRSSDWYPSAAEAPAPVVHFAPIAAGDVVLDSQTSDVAQHLDDHYNDAIAVEMESAGFAAAGQVNEHVVSVTIRGISDGAGGAKEQTDNKGWQQIAARNAAAFAAAVAAELGDESETGAGEPAADPATPPTPQVHNTNIAKHNATVGYQLGINHGELHSGTDPRDRS
ncbi:MAG: purine phosphorylase [Streptosporangiales bacterium]|nr:purine phosphorylase [Streptosporangiales bacterium]